jgi:hypothetical protein
LVERGFAKIGEVVLESTGGHEVIDEVEVVRSFEHFVAPDDVGRGGLLKHGD